MENKPSALKAFLIRWGITTVAVLLAANIVEGISYPDWKSLIVASLVLGILNAFLRPILYVLTLPLLIVTLGLFTLVINAVLLYFVGWLLKGFQVAGFWPAFYGGVIISVVSWIGNRLFGGEKMNVKWQVNRKASPQRPPPPSGSGPVIDV